MSRRPAITVLMPVRDAVSTLDACMDSIGAQTFTDYELLVVDDGSRDGSMTIVSRHAGADSRIRVLRGPRSGLVACLNDGLAEARAPLVARMDADDLMHPERLGLQRRLLRERPRVDLVAARVRAFPAHALSAGMRAYVKWQNGCATVSAMRDEIYVESPVTHSSVMYRRAVVRDAGGYRDGDFPEDYELWLRLMAHGSRFAKIPRCLLDWRQSPNSHSRRDSRYARDAFDRLRATYLARDPRLAAGRPLAYWGAGRRTRGRAQHLVAKGFVPHVWIDIDPRKLGNRIDGAVVEPPDWLHGCAHATRPFVLGYVASHGAREEMAAALGAMGYRRGRDFLMVG
jgi:glycosyltransferase involved in cell wall biosynthesis